MKGLQQLHYIYARMIPRKGMLLFTSQKFQFARLKDQHIYLIPKLYQF